MLIVEACTFTLGPFTVVQRPRFDSPAWASYLIFRGKLFVGKQFSRPNLDQCVWLEQHTDGTYAAESTFKRIEFSRGVYFGKGGPRVKREAHAIDIPEDAAPEPA